MSKYMAIMAFAIFVFAAILGVGISLAQDQGGENDGGTTPDSSGTSDAVPGSANQVNQPEEYLDVAMAPDQPYNANLRIAGSALRPRDSTVEWVASGGGGCVYASSGAVSIWWNAGVYLPQGSTVKFVRMYVNDTNATNNAAGYFTVYDLYGDVYEEWGMNSSGSSGKIYGTTAEFTHTIDYEYYSYMVNWKPNELGSDMQMCGFRIYYHTPPGAVALPLIMNNITGR